jgi:hypothetical protein
MQQEAIAGILTAVPPTLMVLIGILLNRNDINRLDGRISGLESSLRAEMSGMRSELNGRIDGVRGDLTNFRSQVHNDLMTIMGINNELDKRVSVLEEKSSSK